MKIIENKKEKLSCLLETEEGLANAIRRSCLEIPILAIDEIEFYKNDSILYDEVMGLRLGLIPIITPGDMDLKEDCKCKGKGCSNCQVEFKLNAKGPCIVYSKELKGKEDVAYEEIPIVELSDGQELSFVAKARLGKGIEHTKFSPGLIYYSNTPLIEKVDKKDVEEKQIIHVEEKEFNEIKKEEKIAYDFINENVEYNGEIIHIKPNKEEILFTIEPWGQISAKEIMLKAIEALKKNLKSIK
jgi:DNA-directed RNA polymerase subunit D